MARSFGWVCYDYMRGQPSGYAALFVYAVTKRGTKADINDMFVSVEKRVHTTMVVIRH